MSQVPTPIDLSQLRPGDVLLYGGGGFFDRIIRVKTWSHFSHAEVFDGHDHEGAPRSLAARNGIGVNRYLLRDHDLRAVYRPKLALDLPTGRAWFERDARHQPYDWWGLLAFTSASLQGRENNRMFCSEFAARYLRVCIAAATFGTIGTRRIRDLLADHDLDPWNGKDADAISPRDMSVSPMIPPVMAADPRYLR